jgi:hypothetical protein
MLNDPEYEKLKKTIHSLGPVLPGTLRTVYLRCGKKNCRCQSDKKNRWHGPYSFWDRKEGKRLSSRSLTAESAKAIRGWIKNRRLLERIVSKMLEHGVKVTSQIYKSKKG